MKHFSFHSKTIAFLILLREEFNKCARRSYSHLITDFCSDRSCSVINLMSKNFHFLLGVFIFILSDYKVVLRETCCSSISKKCKISELLTDLEIVAFQENTIHFSYFELMQNVFMNLFMIIKKSIIKWY